MCELDDVVPFTFDHEGWYVDDNDDATLPPEMVKEGRMNEMKGFEQRLEVNARIRVYIPSVSGGWTWQ